MIRYENIHLAVTDVDRSRKFYTEILGLKVVKMLGRAVELEGGIRLQPEETWNGYLSTKDIMNHHNGGELYFEEDDMSAFITRLNSYQVEYVHRPLTQKWGQKVVRFYDPDGHMIEVGEALANVVKRFYLSGMDEFEIAKKMEISIEFVCELLG